MKVHSQLIDKISKSNIQARIHIYSFSKLYSRIEGHIKGTRRATNTKWFTATVQPNVVEPSLAC